MKRRIYLILLSLIFTLYLNLNSTLSFGQYSTQDEQALSGRVNDMGDYVEEIPEFKEMIKTPETKKRKAFANVGHEASGVVTREDGVIELF